MLNFTIYIGAQPLEIGQTWAAVNSSIMLRPPTIVLARWNALLQFLIPAARWLYEAVLIAVNASMDVEKG
jgi:hypothetical protein